jgi:hypothetical protein
MRDMDWPSTPHRPTLRGVRDSIYVDSKHASSTNRHVLRQYQAHATSLQAFPEQFIGPHHHPQPNQRGAKVKQGKICPVAALLPASYPAGSMIPHEWAGRMAPNPIGLPVGLMQPHHRTAAAVIDIVPRVCNPADWASHTEASTPR